MSASLQRRTSKRHKCDATSKFYSTVQFLFVSDAPCFSFKKLIVSTPRLLHNLHTMSLAKAAPGGLKDHKCKKMALHIRPPIPYVPEKDSVQETVSSFKDNHLKMLINKGTELRVPIWHSDMHEAFLIHVGSVQEVVEKQKGILSPLRNIPKLTPTSARGSIS